MVVPVHQSRKYSDFRFFLILGLSLFGGLISAWAEGQSSHLCLITKMLQWSSLHVAFSYQLLYCIYLVARMMAVFCIVEARQSWPRIIAGLLLFPLFASESGLSDYHLK